jgi:hypothetical protein
MRLSSLYEHCVPMLMREWMRWANGDMHIHTPNVSTNTNTSTRQLAIEFDDVHELELERPFDVNMLNKTKKGMSMYIFISYLYLFI